MDVMGIVEALNRKFESDNCRKGVHFILHKRIENCAIKAYKRIEWTLWYVCDDSKYKVADIGYTARMVTEKEDTDVTLYMESQLLMAVFSLFQDNTGMKDMLNGNFTGYEI